MNLIPALIGCSVLFGLIYSIIFDFKYFLNLFKFSEQNNIYKFFILSFIITFFIVLWTSGIIF